MDDSISRQATIEHLKKRLIETAINNTGVTARCDSIFEDTAENRIGTWINEVPSAQPAQPRWIPCSERLPEPGGYYLVTRQYFGWNCTEYRDIDIARYDFDGWHKADTVLAWYELPKPWEGEKGG